MRQEKLSFCRICAAACGITVEVDDNLDGERVVRVRGDQGHPVSRGYTCSKGRALGAFHHDPNRLDDPIVDGTVTTWDAALDDLGVRLQAVVDAHGADRVGAYLGTGLAYDVNGWMSADRLFALLRTRQRYTPVTIDNAPALRAAELVSGTPHLNPVWDPDRSRLLLVFGSNPVVSHGYGTTLADPVTRLRDFRVGRRRDLGASTRAAPRRPPSRTITSRPGPAPTPSCSRGSYASSSPMAPTTTSSSTTRTPPTSSA